MSRREYIETGNPFQPPAEIDDEPFVFVKGPLVASKLSFDKLFNDTWNLYKNHLGMLIGIVVIMSVPNFLQNVLGQILQLLASSGAVSQEVFIGMLLFLYFISFIAWVASIWLYLGALRMILSIARGNPSPPFSMIFSEGRLVLKAVLVGIILFIVALPFVGVAIGILFPLWYYNQGAADVTIPIVITLVVSLVSVLGLCYVNARLFWSYLFLADRNEGIFESLGSSWRFSRGNVSVIVLSYIVFGLIGALGMLLCCVGMILTMPIVHCFTVIAYLIMTGQPYLYSEGSRPDNRLESRRDEW
ncbi:MAG TPA: hypothetical protein DEB39_12500 [Planctomycetaceae bacterium]|nr:hypothetical protein [Planctomycetaceae bacterium]